MPDPLTIELPGLDPAELSGRAPREGQLGRAVTPDQIVTVAERTLAAASDPLFATVEGLVGLDGRARRRRTPFALRALLLAIEDGRLGGHQDLRFPLPLAPDQDLDTDSYRYRGFHQESAVATYHCRSANSSRWDVHHLWHAVQGFVWYPDLPRGTIYASARLNEAACETHWFYLEGMLSPRCAEHQRFDPSRQTHWPDCRHCDSATARAGAAEAADLARGALRFWDSEAASIDLFLLTHRVAPNPLSGSIENWLEAWRYLRHHERRIRSRPFTRWVEGFLAPGRDYDTTHAGLRDRIAARLLRLLTGPIAVDVERARLAQVRRVLQDVAQRLLQAAHVGLVPESAVAPVHEATSGLTPETDLPHARQLAWRALLAVAGDARSEPALALGYDLRPVLGDPPPGSRSGVARRLAEDGLTFLALDGTLAAALPATTRAAGAALGEQALARAVVGTPDFRAGVRGLEDLALEALASEPALADLARFEALQRAEDPGDRGLREDLFAVDLDPARIDPGTLVRLNPSLIEHIFDHDVVAALGGGAAQKTPTHVWAGTHLGRPLCAGCDDLAPIAAALKRPRPLGEITGAGGALAGRSELALDLLRRGLLVAVAPPR
jgi:hypothetical protein